MYLVLSTACARQTPDSVVRTFFQAYADGDGSALVSCMSSSSMTDIDEYLLQLKESPDESASYLTMIGIEVTSEELANMNSGDFVTALFNSPVYAEELPDFSSTEFGEAAIYGDRALVPFTVNGIREEIELVLEDNCWKIIGNGMEIL